MRIKPRKHNISKVKYRRLNTSDVHEDFKGIKVKKIGKSIKKGTKKAIKQTSKGIQKAAKASLGGIMVAIKAMMKVLNKITKFIGNIDNYFMKFWRGMKFMDNVKNATAIGLTVTIPFIGQLIARFMLYNGSMDHPWLFLFAVPPLTLVPAFAMIFGYIGKLDGGRPWDTIVWVPIIINTIGLFMTKSDRKYHAVKLFLTIGSFILVYWYKSTKICKKEGKAPTNKLAMDSIISYMFMIFFAFALPYIPFIGSVFKILLGFLPLSDVFFQAFAVAIVYIITNIVNGSFKWHCKAKIKDDDVYILLLCAMLLTAISAFSPGDAMSMISQMEKNALNPSRASAMVSKMNLGKFSK